MDIITWLARVLRKSIRSSSRDNGETSVAVSRPGIKQPTKLAMRMFEFCPDLEKSRRRPMSAQIARVLALVGF